MHWQIFGTLPQGFEQGILEFCGDLISNSRVLKSLKSAKTPFAFVLKKAKNDEYIAFRSLFSHHSVYYFYDGREFSISTDKKALLKRVKKELDLSALSEYLSFMSSKKSFFKHVFELGAGQFLRYKNAKLEIGTFDSLDDFSSLEFPSKTLEFPTLLKSRILTTLNEQISLYLAQKPCALLSGGLDSSLLSALFAKQSEQKIKAFNLAFLDAPHYDESAFARVSAEFIGCELESVNLGKKDFLEGFYKADFCAEPLADSAGIALRFLCEKIAKEGFSTAFSAEGADECFLGYDLYFRVLEFYRNDLPQARYPAISKDSEYLRRKALGLPIYGGFCEVFTRYQKELLFAGYADFEDICVGEPIFQYQNPYKELRQMRYMDFSIASHGMVARKLGAMSDIVDIKTPFFALAKLALSLENPSPNLVPKELLKAVAKEQNLLSDEIIFRKKKGLSTPFLEWVLKEMDASEQILKANKILGFPLFSEVFVRELERKARRGRFKQHLWSLLCFSCWLDKYFG